MWGLQPRKFNLDLEETAPLFWVNIPRIQISAGGKTGFVTEVRPILRGIWRKLMRRESGILQRAQYNQRRKAFGSEFFTLCWRVVMRRHGCVFQKQTLSSLSWFTARTVAVLFSRWIVFTQFYRGAQTRWLKPLPSLPRTLVMCELS